MDTFLDCLKIFGAMIGVMIALCIIASSFGRY